MRKQKQIKVRSKIDQTLFSLLIVAIVTASFLAAAQSTNLFLFRSRSEVAAGTCVAPSNYPQAPNGGMTYVYWNFYPTSPLTSLHATANIFNDPGNTSDEFLQFYQGNIDGTTQYFGIQTTGRVLLSAFGTSDPANIRPDAGAYAVTDAEQGSNFISLRRDFGSLPAGQYSVDLTRGSFDGTGDWYDFYVTFPGQGQQHLGAMRFARSNNSTPSSIKDGGISWTEFWDNNGSTLLPVPVWHVSMKVTANNGLVANTVTSAYSAMPNSDTFATAAGGDVDMTIGGDTPRCHAAGTLWQGFTNTSGGTGSGGGSGGGGSSSGGGGTPAGSGGGGSPSTPGTTPTPTPGVAPEKPVTSPTSNTKTTSSNQKTTTTSPTTTKDEFSGPRSLPNQPVTLTDPNSGAPLPDGAVAATTSHSHKGTVIAMVLGAITMMLVTGRPIVRRLAARRYTNKYIKRLSDPDLYYEYNSRNNRR